MIQPTCFDSSLFFQLLVKIIGVVCHLTLNGNRLCHADNACTHSGCPCTKPANRETVWAIISSCLFFFPKQDSFPESLSITSEFSNLPTVNFTSRHCATPPYWKTIELFWVCKDLHFTCPAPAALYQSILVWPGGRRLMSLQSPLHRSPHGPDWAVAAAESLRWQPSSAGTSRSSCQPTCSPCGAAEAAWGAGPGTEPLSSAHSCT